MHMPTDDSQHTDPGLPSEGQQPRKSVEVLKNILAAAIVVEMVGMWVFVLKVITQIKKEAGVPKFSLALLAVGLSLIGFGFAKWLAPRIPGISGTKTLKYMVGLLLAAYALYPTYENFRGDDDISLATIGLAGVKTIEDMKAVAPRLTVLQHGRWTYRMEVTQRDARRLSRHGYRLRLIQNPEQRMKVKKIERLPAGVPDVMIQEMIRAVSPDSLLNTIRRLERFGTRADHSAQADSAAELLTREFKRYGLEVESQAFGEVLPDYLDVQVVDENTLFVSSFQGQLFCSTNGGRTWICRPTGLAPLARLAFINSRTGYALSLLAGVFATSNGGRTWRELRPDSVWGFSDVRCLSEREALIVGKGGRILRTEDGGNRWKRVYVPTDKNLQRIDSPDRKNVWVVGDAGTLLHSTNLGKTWQQVHPGISHNLFDIQFHDRQRGIVLGESATVLNTTDGGRSWKLLRTDLHEARPTEMFFTSVLHGWLTDARSSGFLVETNDGGRHWKEAQAGVRTTKKLSGRNRNTILACGLQGALFISKDRGTTWQPLSSKLETIGRLRSRNICATLRGEGQSDGEIILVGHYDSARNAPGANDNASGTAAVLEAARICSRYRFERTIRFLAAAAEERGLVGSGIYARDARKNGRNIVAVVNADMIGYPVLGDSKRIALSTGQEWTSLMDSTLLFNRRYSLGLILDAHAEFMGGSDHVSFIRQGYSAIDLSEGTAMEIWGGFDPFYHKPLDSSVNVDENLVRNAAQLMIMIAAETAKPIARAGK
jgi:photosystem II stability/assembly factor-like uncharacterized protein